MARALARRVPVVVVAVLSLSLPSTSAWPLPERGLPAHEAGWRSGVRQARQTRQEPQVFEAAVSRVRVDVIVTDDGEFVDDLTAADFRVLEDGEPVELRAVQLVDLEKGSVSSRPPERGRLAGPDEAGALRDALATGGEAAGDLGAIVYYVDGPSLSATTKPRFVEAWRRLLELPELSTTVPRAAYVVDGIGRLRELVPLTRDVDELYGAADELADLALTTPRRMENLLEVVKALPPVDTRAAPGGFEGVSGLEPDLAVQRALATARQYEAEERAESLAAFDRLARFCEALSAREGRVTLIWVSSGVKLMTGGPYIAALAAYRAAVEEASDDSARRDSQPGQRSQWEIGDPDDQIEAARQRVERAANSANVSVYAIDPMPLVESRALASDASVRQAGHSAMLSRPELVGSLDGLRDALRNTAEATGGEAFIHATDLEGALRSIESDASRFYLLTYQAPRSEGDGEYHEIEVEVARSGVEVRARRGYVHRTEDERRTRGLETALSLPGLVDGPPIRAEAYRARSPDGSPMLVLAAGVDVASWFREGEVSAPPVLHAVVLGSRERPVARVEGTLETGGERRGFLPYRTSWALAPGEYEVRVAVQDELGGRLGATSLDVELPAARGWQVGDPGVVWDRGDGVNEPIIGVAGPEQDELVVYLEVYEGEEPSVEGTLRRLAPAPEGDEGRGAARPTDQATVGPATVGPARLNQRADGIHWAAMPLPTDLAPGEYLIELEVRDLQDRRATFEKKLVIRADTR